MASRPSASASDGPSTLGPGEVDLEAGTYRFDLTAIGGGEEYPAFEATVPAGWSSMDGWVVGRPAASGEGFVVTVSFWNVDEVYGHPCQWDGALLQPGPGVDDLVAALVKVPMRSASEPVDVEIDGHSGTYLEWSVPTDIEFDDEANFPGCEGDGAGHFDFRSWTGKGWSHTRYHQGPGQIDRLWILDVDGKRLVIDAFSMPEAADDEVAEIFDVVESIRFLED